MALDSFEQHQPVEPATTIIPGRAVAFIVFAVAFAVDLVLLAMVWTHVFDELPAGVQGFFLIVMLGSFLGGFMSWKADRLSDRIEARLPALLEAALTEVGKSSGTTCTCLAEVVELRKTVATQGGHLAAVEQQISAAVAGAFDPATSATLLQLNRDLNGHRPH